jgi:hypothetical protein
VDTMSAENLRCLRRTVTLILNWKIYLSVSGTGLVLSRLESIGKALNAN